MADTPTSEPTEITAGDTLSWLISLPDYPASAGWVLKYALSKAGSAAISITGTASGDSHLLSVSAATSAAYGAGEWHWTSYVTKGSERYTVGAGVLTILPDPANLPAGHDPRTHAEKGLAAIEAVLEGNLSGSLAEYEINGRKAKLWSHSELLKLRAIYKAQVRRERGGASANPIYLRLNRA